MEVTMLYKTGNFTAAATPADVALDIGFVPDEFILWNHTDLSLATLWISAEGDTSKITKLDTITVSNSDPVKVTKTQGVTVKAAAQTANKVYYWEAKKFV